MKNKNWSLWVGISLLAIPLVIYQVGSSIKDWGAFGVGVLFLYVGLPLIFIGLPLTVVGIIRLIKEK